MVIKDVNVVTLRAEKVRETAYLPIGTVIDAAVKRQNADFFPRLDRTRYADNGVKQINGAS